MKSGIPIEHDTPVEVGKFYWVRHAKIHTQNMLTMRMHTSYVPVLGPEHTDRQFTFTEPHYHVDGRFVLPHSWPIAVDAYGRTNNVVATGPVGGEQKFQGIEVRLRKCIRLTTGLDHRNGELFVQEQYAAWYRKYVGKSCQGKKCPHLGMTMMEENGLLVCPLHHLIGDVGSETIIAPPITIISTSLSKPGFLAHTRDNIEKLKEQYQ